MSRTYDITADLHPGMAAFPGDPPITVRPTHSFAKGDPYNLSELSMGTHAGTHIDPPRHFLPNGLTADRIDLEAINGPCRVVHIPDSHREVSTGDLKGLLHGVSRVLFRTQNSVHWARDEGFFPDYVGLAPETAEYLAAATFRLVGIDSQSIERDPTGQYPVHHTLLGSGCLILEGLRLAEVPPGEYELRCLPLKLRDGDGAPCRAILVAP
ncbi:MAG: cyclase family protein [Thermoplasmata archaeon]|nr:cyclase family protein [Thermoplasmata archaeon]